MNRNTIASCLSRREVRLAAVFMILAMASTTLNATTTTAGTLAASLAGEGNAWIRWSLRIIGGLMSIGGLMQLIGGFTGHDEGYHKVVKCGGGILLMGAGVYILGNVADVIQALSLDQLFSAT